MSEETSFRVTVPVHTVAVDVSARIVSAVEAEVGALFRADTHGHPGGAGWVLARKEAERQVTALIAERLPEDTRAVAVRVYAEVLETEVRAELGKRARARLKGMTDAELSVLLEKAGP